jgi:hypothetical protein
MSFTLGKITGFTEIKKIPENNGIKRNVKKMVFIYSYFKKQGSTILPC